ncbi:MAG: hypothetical protein CXZ00_03855 [Acidobacteria bacterium]|nr:MAG: hypothetical protein CXZ00_03855 [Acidobacteriota bacterium]
MNHPTQVRDRGQPAGMARDPILWPVGLLMAAVGAIWAVFSGMAVESGTYGQPLAAVGLIAFGVLIAGVGKNSRRG